MNISIFSNNKIGVSGKYNDKAVEKVINYLGSDNFALCPNAFNLKCCCPGLNEATNEHCTKCWSEALQAKEATHEKH